MNLVRRPRVIGSLRERRERRAALVEDARTGRIRRILAVRFARMGDLLFTTPALSRLREALPDATLDYCTSPTGSHLVAEHPAVDEVIHFVPGVHRPGHLWRREALRREVSRRGYDLMLVFESDHPTRFWLERLARSAGVRHVVSRSSYVSAAPREGGPFLHSCERHMQLLEMLGVAPDARSYELFAGRAALERADRYLGERGVAPRDDAGRPPLVGLQPGCHHTAVPGARLLPGLRHKFHKTWTEPHWQALTRLAVERLGARVVVFGTRNERRAAERIVGGVPAPARLEPIVAAGETDMPLLVALLARMDAVVSIDTGTMHMAAALGVPTAALFGPTDPGHHGPYRRSASSVVLRSGVACSPCGKEVRRRCASNTCMRELDPERVLRATAALLARRGDQSRRAVREAAGR